MKPDVETSLQRISNSLEKLDSTMGAINVQLRALVNLKIQELSARQNFTIKKDERWFKIAYDKED